MVNSLKIYEILKAGDLTDNHAQAMTVAIQAAESEMTVDFKAFVHQEIAALARQLDQNLERRLAETKTEILRWMFIFWTGQMAITIGLVFAGLKLVK